MRERPEQLAIALMRPGLGLPQTPPRRAAADGFEREERLAMEGRSPLQMDLFKMALFGLQ